MAEKQAEAMGAIAIRAMRAQLVAAMNKCLAADEAGDQKEADKWQKNAENWGKAIKLAMAERKNG